MADSSLSTLLGQTASALMSKILTVDGAGSGLDADLLDGQHGGYYLNAANLNAGTLNAARMPALTGDVTSVAGSVAVTINDGVVTLPKMANLAANSIVGNNTGSAAAPQALSAAQVKTLLALTKGDVGLGNVDNTSDLNKPISTAVQTALNSKLDSSSYSAADVLAKLLTVDGTGTSLDADKLDGLDSTDFALADHDHDAAELGLSLYTTTSTTTAGYYRIASVPLSSQYKMVRFRIKAYTAAGTVTESTVEINLAYYSGNTGSQRTTIIANTSHSYDSSGSSGENAWVLSALRVSFDATNAYIDVNVLKAMVCTIEVRPETINDWVWATGALTVNPTVGSVRNESMTMNWGLSGNRIIAASTSGDATFTKYGVYGESTLSNTADKTGQWEPFAQILYDYNSGYLNGKTLNAAIRLVEFNHNNTVDPDQLDDMRLLIRSTLAPHADGTAFNALVPEVALELEGRTTLTGADFAAVVVSTSTTSKTIRLYVKLKAANTCYGINPESRYGRSFTTGNSHTTNYARLDYLASQAVLVSLPAPAQGSVVNATTTWANNNALTLEGQTAAYFRNASNINAGTIAKAYLPTLDKTDVGLNNVDNTSDANKPISTAQQTALDLKVNKTAASIVDSLNISSTAGSAVLTIEADTTNTNESGNPRIVFKQDGGQGIAEMGFDSSNDFYIQPKVAGSQNDNIYRKDNGGTRRKMWDSGNDGTGSGLDADLLDGLEASDFARGTHKYHPFSNGEYYYDNYSQGNYLRIFTENAFSDTARYAPLSSVEYWDGSAWVAWVGGDTVIKNLFDGREDTYAAIDHTHRKFRFVVTKNTGWPSVTLVVLQGQWSYIVNPPVTVTLENQVASVWTVKDTLVFGSGTTGGEWGTHLKVVNSLHDGQTQTRVTIDITDWTDVPAQNAYDVRFLRFMILSNYTGSSLEPWSWNYDKVVNFKASPTALGNAIWHAGNDGAGSGLDADKLDGQEGSYYQNATNLNAGTLADGRLSTNVPLKGSNNTFTGNNTYTGVNTWQTGVADSFNIHGVGDGYAGGTMVTIKNDGTATSNNYIRLQTDANGTPINFADFRYDGASGLNIATPGTVKINSNAIWHAGNLTPVTALDGLSDVAITSPASGQTLRFNGSTFVNAALAKGDVGLGNVDNTSDANKPVSTATQVALDLKINSSLIGAANGVVPLGSDSKIAATYLPSYVDDILEYANYASLPATGETGKLYVTVDNNNQYRWSGSTYTQFTSSPGTTDAVVEGSTNLYFTNARAVAAITGAASSIATANLTASRALVSDGSGKVAVASVTSTELGYVAGVTSAIQTQLNAKLASSSYTAADVLAKLLTVDGAASLLDADKLDGLEASAFALVGHDHTVNASAATDNVYANIPDGVSIATYTTAQGSPVDFSVLATLSAADNRVVQMAMGSQSSEFYWRGHRSADGGWQAWRRVWHDGNFNPASYATLASPALSGTPTAPTATAGTNTTQLATTAFVQAGITANNALYAALSSSPTFTGNVIAQGGNIVSQASNPSGNAHVWVRDETGGNQGLLYWERTSDTLRLRRYNAAGTGAEGELQLGATDVTWNGNNIWHAGNFTPSSYVDKSTDQTDISGAKTFLGTVLLQGTASGMQLANPAWQWRTETAVRRIRMQYAATDAADGAFNIQKWNGSAWSTLTSIDTSGVFSVGGNAVWHAGNLDSFTEAFKSNTLYYNGTGGANSIDCDTLPTGSKALVSSTGNTNNPTVAGVAFWHIETIQSYNTASATRIQRAWSYDAPNSFAMRTLQSGIWTAWSYFWSDANFDPATKANTASPTLTGTVTMDSATVNIGGTTGTLNFGSAAVRQMINLWGTVYGIGVQNNTLYFRANTGGGFSWHQGGVHSATANDPGAGGAELMRLSTTGDLSLGGSVASGGMTSSANFTHAAGNGKGFWFWNGGDLYGMYMSSSADATYGGRVTGETTSDYNMYFKMNGGTNRGFVWKNGSTIVGGLDASGNFRAVGSVVGVSAVIAATGGRIYVGYDSGVANSISCSGWFRSNGNSGWYNSDWAGGIYMTDATYLRSYNNKAMTASDFVISSDERLKDHVRPLEYRGRLRPVAYFHKESKRIEVGFIAQEVQKLYPEVVGVFGENGFLNLSYPKITAILSKQINTVEDKVVVLEAENKELRDKVSDLEAKLAQVMQHLGLS